VSLVVDASIWVSAFIPADVHHQTTRAWLVAASPTETFVTPALGLVETAGAVARRTGSELLARRACRAIERLPNVLVVIPDGALWDAALSAAAGRSLRGADAVYVAVADVLGLPLVTWDREQRDRAGRRVKVTSPTR
jgi:predicted nucleic acid-binding protein